MRGAVTERPHPWEGNRWLRSWGPQVILKLDCLALIKRVEIACLRRCIWPRLVLLSFVVHSWRLNNSLLSSELCLAFGQVFLQGTVRDFVTNLNCSHSCVALLVAGSASWRIPLALQFLPGISLCLGCFFLPPSPRLLVLRGQMDKAQETLAKLRLRTPEEAKKDPLIQVFLFCLRQ